MNTIFRFCSTFLLGVFASGAALAAPTDFFHDYGRAIDGGKGSIAATIDNDTLLMNRQDGFYTSGALIERKFWLESLEQSEAFGWRIGQELYTASDIKLPPALIGAHDHPYAGWLFFGLYKQHWRSDGSHLHAGIDIGCIGPCAGGEWTQTTLHRVIHQPLPQGWSTQVKNEPGIVLWGDFATPKWSPQPSFDLTPSVHARVGNIYTDAGAAVTMRAGRLNSLPQLPTFHAYLRLDATAVIYNATLQGGYLSSDNPHVVDPKRAVGEAELGMQWSDGEYSIQASVVRRSNEIEGLPNSIGAQSFARFRLTYWN